MSEPIRLQKLLSQAGVAARRKGEVLITSGRVQVNGKTVTILGTKVDPLRDRVDVDGVRVKPQSKLMYYLLNKPKGCVTTMSDPEGRPTVMDFLPQDLPVKLRPVGRLDFYTEGVLILTNDGDLHAALLAPRRIIEKTYQAKIKGKVTDETLTILRNGVKLDDGRRTLPAKIDRMKTTGQHTVTELHTWVIITITEGQSRQIHRMFEAVDHEVLKLARVSFAGLTFFGVRVGACRPLLPEEILALRQTAGIVAEQASTERGPQQPRKPRHLRGADGGRKSKTTRDA